MSTKIETRYTSSSKPVKVYNDFQLKEIFLIEKPMISGKIDLVNVNSSQQKFEETNCRMNALKITNTIDVRTLVAKNSIDLNEKLVTDFFYF